MNQTLFPDLVINGETVPHALVAAEVQNHAAPRGKPGIAWRKAARAVASPPVLPAWRTHVSIGPFGPTSVAEALLTLLGIMAISRRAGSSG